MQDVKRSMISGIETIVGTIKSVYNTHNVAVDEKSFKSAIVCDKILPYVVETLNETYDVQIEAFSARNHTVAQLAEIVQWFTGERIQEQILDIIEKVTFMNREDLNPMYSIEDLDLDSLVLANVVSALNDEYPHVSITDQDIRRFQKISGLLGHILKQMHEKQ